MRSAILAAVLWGAGACVRADEALRALPAEDTRAWIAGLAKSAAREKETARCAREIDARGEAGRAELLAFLADIRNQPRSAREGAVRLAGELALRDAEPQIAALALRDPDKQVRSVAAQWIASVVGRTPDAVLKGLASSDEGTARHAAETVAVVRDRRGVEAMVEVVRVVMDLRLDQATVTGFREIDAGAALGGQDAGAAPLNIELPEVERLSLRTNVATPAMRSVQKVFHERIVGRPLATRGDLDRWWDGQKDALR